MAGKSILKSLLTRNIAGAGIVALINHSINSSAASKNLLKPEDGSYYHWRYGKVFYKKRGTGSKKLLLIHNIDPASCRIEWNRMEEYLLNDYTVYSLDLPGCGCSDKPSLTYTLYFFSTLIRDFVKDVIAAPCEAAGSGLSGFAAAAAVHETKGLITHVYMIGTKKAEDFMTVPDVLCRAIRYIVSAPIIGTAVFNYYASKKNITFRLEEKMFNNPFKLQETLTDSLYEGAHRGKGMGRNLLASLLGHYISFPVAGLLKKMEIPITLISGDNDPQINKICKSYLRINPKIEIIKIKETKLVPHMESPKETAQVFLR